METERPFIEGQRMNTETVQSNNHQTYKSIDSFYQHFIFNLLLDGLRNHTSTASFRPTVHYTYTTKLGVMSMFILFLYVMANIRNAMLLCLNILRTLISHFNCYK